MPKVPFVPGSQSTTTAKTGEPIERNTLFGESFAHVIADIEKPEASLLYRWVIWRISCFYLRGNLGR